MTVGFPLSAKANNISSSKTTENNRPSCVKTIKSKFCYYHGNLKTASFVALVVLEAASGRDSYTGQ